MKLFLSIIVSSLVIVAITAQPGRRCLQTPPKWAGDMREVDYDRRTFRFAEVIYSVSEESIYVKEYESDQGQRPIVKQEWFDFKGGMKYNQTGKTSDCKGYPLTSTFRPFGVPPQAVFEGIEYLGAEAAGLGLLVDQFVENHEGGRSLYRGSWVPVKGDDTTCVPVLESFIERGGRFSDSRNVHTEFLNITATNNPAPAHCNPTRLVY